MPRLTRKWTIAIALFVAAALVFVSVATHTQFGLFLPILATIIVGLTAARSVRFDPLTARPIDQPSGSSLSRAPPA